MFKNITFFLLVFSFQCINAQITLTHNVGNTLVETDMISCERNEGWSRIFELSDFGISPNEQFIINSAQVALSKSSNGSNLSLRVYSIDENFPNFFYSLYPRTLLGSRSMGLAPIINGAPEIIQTDFDEPIIIPAGIEKILVTVYKTTQVYNPASPEVFVAGTVNDTGKSWYTGCDDNYSLRATTELTNPVPDANFYINVTGETFNPKSLGGTTRLSHNVCDDLIETRIHSCTSDYIYWAREFILKDFGISTNEEFTINSGQVGINKTGWLPEIRFNIYKIDENFPASFSETDLIGSSQFQELSPNISRSSQIIEVQFETPIVIPADVERILVEVHKGIVSGDGLAFIAGSAQDTGESYQRGCLTGGPYATEYVAISDLNILDANFYINVTGNVNHVTNNFDMNISNICSEFLKEFRIGNETNIASVVWNFGDTASGADNSSTELSPFHDFSVDGAYTVTATITANDGSREILSETIDVKEPPNAYGIDDFYACEDAFNTGISSSFDLSMVKQQVLGGQTGKTVTFIDGSGNEYGYLQSSFKNTVRDRETIVARVSHRENLCCFSEITFDLIVNPIPNVEAIEDLVVCNSKSNGFASFNLEPIKENIIGNSTNIDVAFYHENGQIINNPINAITNSVANEEVIRVRAINNATNCYNENTFKLKIAPLPVVNNIKELIGCDDNNDGISEYFNTKNVSLEVLGIQTDMDVSYFDSNGTPLPNPLPNPYTNTNAIREVITVRVTNPQTTCYAETTLVLNAASQPQINKPKTLYGCNIGDGFANFDTSAIEAEIIGSQTGLKVTYFDTSGNELPSPLPFSFTNTQAWSQTINIKVENELNSLCSSETSIDLIVNESEPFSINEIYTICNQEPSLSISVAPNLDSYVWQFENGDIISNTFEAKLIDTGNYTITIGTNKNGVYCENSFEFKLLRSSPPSIIDINYQELSDNNTIEVTASGDGDFEYSLDGINYQSSNIFRNVLGGSYKVILRDRNGCGEDLKEITLLDYPKFFTPNNDGVNDTWQINGIGNYPNAKIYIYDRYGRFFQQINPLKEGWDGISNGEHMISSDYWFQVDLGNGETFSGHFTLKR